VKAHDVLGDPREGAVAERQRNAGDHDVDAQHEQCHLVPVGSQKHLQFGARLEMMVPAKIKNMAKMEKTQF
jgi:hypothetical protein